MISRMIQTKVLIISTMHAPQIYSIRKNFKNALNDFNSESDEGAKIFNNATQRDFTKGGIAAFNTATARWP